MQRNQIPGRYDDAAFRRYEPYIYQCLIALPSNSIIDTGNLSLKTFYGRFLDAMKYFLETDIESTLIDKETLRKVRKNGATIRYSGDELIFGYNAVDKQEDKLSAEIKRNVLPGHDFELAHACAVIISREVLTPGTAFVFVELPEDTITSLQTKYPNLLFTQEGGFTNMM